ncbi:unnamed protein product [Blepharisma stoltei]|uniref:LAGLIDADG homing endonuclease n=1 Tax=Blepharisma stoltei TaxID=1481888 RepID=A0AAU9JH47_9CILI|nr:unnamed protein product [Blepharisma stoltei]
MLSGRLKDEIIRYYKEGFTCLQIKSMINEVRKQNFLRDKIKNCIDYYSAKYPINLTMESMIELLNKCDNYMIGTDNKNGRLFFTEGLRVDKWRLLGDVIAIDSTYNINNIFRCAIFFVTIDKWIKLCLSDVSL